MNSFAQYMGMEDRVGGRRFCNVRSVPLSVDKTSELSPEEQVAFQLAFEANRIGFSGEKVIYATIEKDCFTSPFCKLITRTRTQRFLAWITRSF